MYAPYVVLTLLIVILTPLVGALVFGPCTAVVTCVPLAAWMASWLYAGIQLESNKRAERSDALFAVLDPDTYTDVGKAWLRRAKLLFIAFPIVGLVFSWIGRAVCTDFPR